MAKNPDRIQSSSLDQLRLYLNRQASSLGRYILEQSLYALIGWIPTVIGIGLRGWQKDKVGEGADPTL